ncbi:MAG: hypothetical protein K8U57_18485 [Planctomycetes bacterium]|nr:hypothetical protein [Planctomycetota bacterium]
MLRIATALMFTFAAVTFAGAAEDKKPADKDGEKPIKADVLIKHDATAGKAKAGEVVGIDVQYPVAPPFPSDFSVTVDGKKVKFDQRKTPVTVNGKPVVGVANNTVYFKAEGKGKQKVVIEYKKGDEKVKREVELEVAE